MNNFIYKSTSSDLYANNIVLKDDNNKFSSVSGELTLENIKGNLSFNTTSGDVNFDKLLGSVSGNTISGDVDIRISKDIGLKTKLETVSGDIDVFPSIRTLEKSKRSFEGTMGSNVDYNFNISTTSGDINIYE